VGSSPTLGVIFFLHHQLFCSSPFFLLAFILECPNPQRPGCPVFYDLLRPQFVHHFPKPLCSDAWTSWMDKNEETAINRTILEATTYLTQTLVPKVSKELIDSDQKTLAQSLIDQIHEKGLNCRHLGLIRRGVLEFKRTIRGQPELLVKCDHVSKLLLTECIARTMKNELRLLMRKKVNSDSTSLELIYNFIRTKFFKTGSFHPLSPITSSLRVLHLLPDKAQFIIPILAQSV
jgi:hypothetical protein